MTNNNSIAINPNDDFYAIAADANARLDSMLESVSEMGEISEDAHKRLEEMVNKVKSLKDSLDKRAKTKNERPISLKESKSTDMIPTTAVVKDAAPSVDKACDDPYVISVNDAAPSVDKACDDPYVISSDEYKNTDVNDHVIELVHGNPSPNKDYNITEDIKKKYDQLKKGANNWSTPAVKTENLKRMTEMVFDNISPNDKKNYVKYHLCIKDNLHHDGKPIYSNVLKIIAHNAMNSINIDDFTHAIKDHSMSDNNSLLNSGLFIYKSSDESLISSTYNPDSYIELWIPKNIENQYISNNENCVSYKLGYGSPTLTGALLSFDDIKNILLNPKVIAIKSFANYYGMHDQHVNFHRDIKNYNYWYQDIDMSDDIIDEMVLI